MKWLTYLTFSVTRDWINSVMYAHIILAALFPLLLLVLSHSFRCHIGRSLPSMACPSVFTIGAFPINAAYELFIFRSRINAILFFFRPFGASLCAVLVANDLVVAAMMVRWCWEHNKFHLNLASSKRMCAQRLSLP